MNLALFYEIKLLLRTLHDANTNKADLFKANLVFSFIICF